MEVKKYYCDICKDGEVKAKDKGHRMELQVIYTTEQTEGRSCEPHLYALTVDVCPKCLAKILAGNYVWASGAQGYHEFRFKDKEDI